MNHFIPIHFSDFILKIFTRCVNVCFTTYRVYVTFSKSYFDIYLISKSILFFCSLIIVMWLMKQIKCLLPVLRKRSTKIRPLLPFIFIISIKQMKSINNKQRTWKTAKYWRTEKYSTYLNTIVLSVRLLL